MSSQEIQAKTEFVADPAEVDRRMAEIRANIQVHFDRSTLSPERQESFYAYMREQVPITMEQETRGVSPSQLANARQTRLHTPYQLTEHEFSAVLLPSLQHIDYIPNPDDLSFSGETLQSTMFLCASTDWKEQREGKEGLIGKCDDLYVSTFIQLAASNYRVLMKCEQEGVTRVNALYSSRHVCIQCQKQESEIMEAAQILASVRAGIYPFAHDISDGDELVYLCPGPKLMLFDNGIDAAKHQKSMAGVKASQDKYQAEAAANQKGNQ